MSRRKGFFESRNPIMTDKVFQRANQNQTLDNDFIQARGARMTVTGAVNKTMILTGILLITALFSFTSPSPLLTWGGAIGGFIVVLISVYKLLRKYIKCVTSYTQIMIKYIPMSIFL